MISKEAGDLMNKLQRLKTPERSQNKKIRNMNQSIIEYESKLKKWLVKFDFQMSDLEQEIKTMRENQKRQQEKTIQEIQNYELTLKKLLNSYSREATKANQKLNSMVSSVKQQMKLSLKQKLKKETDSLQNYKNMSQKLEDLITIVRTKQKQSIDDYQRIKNIMRDKVNTLSESNQVYLQEVTMQSQSLSAELQALETQMEDQFLKLIKKYDNRVYQTNKIINGMIQYATEN